MYGELSCLLWEVDTFSKGKATKSKLLFLLSEMGSTYERKNLLHLRAMYFLCRRHLVCKKANKVRKVGSFVKMADNLPNVASLHEVLMRVKLLGWRPGPSCSKLTMSLVNVSLKL